MAIARGAGTEIIRSHAFEDISTDTHLIIGVQHHIYTVLSIVVYAAALNNANSNAQIYLVGYDAYGSDSQQNIALFYAKPQVGETFIWDNKFSFNGGEPTDYSGAMNSIADQDLIADQAESGIPQWLWYDTGSASDHHNVFVTFIDQNNA